MRFLTALHTLMNRFVPLLLSLGCGAILLLSCASVTPRAKSWEVVLGEVPKTALSPDQLYESVNVTQDFIPSGRFGRRVKDPLQPRFITIHSTQNPRGDALAHAKALKNGKIRGGVTGYLDWHFTVQDDLAIQHLPTTERGEHADFDGPGNTSSIAIEMCEHQGNDLPNTIDRTAGLTAWLMYTHRIPLSNVVPHHHWPRQGYDPPHKNCPHFLLDGGQPGPTWRWFQARVRAHHARLTSQESLLAGAE